VISNAVETDFTYDPLSASEKREPIQMNVGEVFEIRDLRSHSTGAVVTLALLLAGTVCVRPDPKRKDFFEVEGGSEIYYIHVPPLTGIIYLLAVWQNAVAQSNSVLRSGFTSAERCSPLEFTVTSSVSHIAMQLQRSRRL